MNPFASNTTFKSALLELFNIADIRINGDRPWDIHVHNDGFYRRVITELSVGLGESYMDGWWDCRSLDQFFFRLLSNNLQEKIAKTPSMIYYYYLSRLVNLQTKYRLRKSVAVSYERGLDLYLAFLDPYHQYSCGYFQDTGDLAEAQERKMDLICRKLYLEPGDRVLDIGCGWGGLAKFIAERYGCRVTGINIAGQQIEYARRFCSGLNVEILEMDYRDLAHESMRGRFNKIVSVGMIEHIGYKNYRRYMEAVSHCLADDGIFLLHSIGSNTSETGTTGNLWLAKYIFPQSLTPSMPQLSAAAENLFIVQDVHNFGLYYDKTLMGWAENFENNWDTLRGQYNERFRRMWRYYLLSCAGGFRAGYNQLWQIVFTKIGERRMYCSLR